MKFVSSLRKYGNEVSYKGYSIIISENNVYVNSELILEDCISEGAGKLYAKSYIDSIIILEDTEIVTTESIVNTAMRHHGIKLTNTLVESYKELILAEEFTLDPVVLELREGKSSLYGKIEFKLNDGSVVAVNESTVDKLLSLNVDKYKLVDFMKESKKNFVSVIKELRD